MKPEKILMVDDDPNILQGYQRQLRRKFSTEIALGGDEGLAIIDKQGPFAVVVADMKMPRMNGIQFLQEVQAKTPNTVRMMLTGNSDQQTAIDAVNDGNIFRFLTKPCPIGIMVQTLDAGINQYRLITAEKELLGKTLNGSLKVLIDVLALVNPTAFSQSSRLKRYVRYISTKLRLQDSWQLELAALLSQIGCVTLPPDILEKISAGDPLSPEEHEMYTSHPTVAHDLLINIPRLESIARMILYQQESYSSLKERYADRKDKLVFYGAQMLNVVINFDRMTSADIPLKKVIKIMIDNRGEYDPAIVAALQDIKLDEEEMAAKTLNVYELNMNMVIDEDVRSSNGLLLVARGQKVNHAVLKSLRNFWALGGIAETVRVLIPSQDPKKNTKETVTA